jgi:hypothetical protein
LDAGTKSRHDDLEKAGIGVPSLSDLIGTWRVTGFQEWAPDGREFLPLGEAPVGYAAFGRSGRIFIQLSRSTAEGASPDQVAASFIAYFGTFAVSGDTLTIAIESGNEPHDVATTQTRTITLDGDVLTIGIPGKFQATLRRASA